MTHSTAQRLRTGKLVPMFSIALLTLASLCLAKPADAAQFTLSGTWGCLFDCLASGSTGLIEGDFTLDDTTGEATAWLITTPLMTYQSGQTGAAYNTGFSLSFLQSDVNQSHWVTLFGNFLDSSVQDTTIWGNENTELRLSNGDYIYGSYWDGEPRVMRLTPETIYDPPRTFEPSKSVPEPSLIAGTLVVLLGGGWLKRRRNGMVSVRP